MRALLFVLGLVSADVWAQAIDYDTKPPADWPNLRIEVVYGDDEQIKRWCSRVPHSFFGKLVGCAKAHFQWDLCMVFLSTKDPEHLKHEGAHCRGYGHVGDSWTPAKAWEQYKATKH